MGDTWGLHEDYMRYTWGIHGVCMRYTRGIHKVFDGYLMVT
jgi:hypothetical protein